MEEKKEKKSNKKIYIFIFTLAIVCAIFGFVDLQVNAAELYGVNIFVMKDVYNDGELDDTGIHHSVTYNSTSPITAYLVNVFNVPSGSSFNTGFYAVSDSPIYNLSGSDVSKSVTDNDGNIKYIAGAYLTGGYSAPYSANIYMKATGAEEIVMLNQYYLYDDFVTNYLAGTLDCYIDYDNLPVDDDMPVVEDLKRNILTFVDKSQYADIVNPEFGQYLTYSYDYVTWTNTSQTFQLQLQTVPIVQYYKSSLTKSTFIKEFYGNWTTKEIYSDVTNTYTKNTYLSLVKTEDEESYAFYSDCVQKYPCEILEETELYFGYRLRYVDVENEKAGPWVVLIPNQEKNSYVCYIEFSDSTSTDLGGADGITNVYDAEDTTLEDAKNDVDTENKFKDEYEVVDNEVDVQEATNWLQTVVNFIKSTPQLVGNVLSFLPQPILYGVYVVIFLGVIASGIAVIRALI